MRFGTDRQHGCDKRPGPSSARNLSATRKTFALERLSRFQRKALPWDAGG